MAEGGRNLRINPFTVDEADHIAMVGKNGMNGWRSFFRISDATDKKDAMLIYGGVEIMRLDKILQDAREGDVYIKLKLKLTDYFAPNKNVHYNRYLFLKMRPYSGESTISYTARLSEMAVNCEFHDCDERILEHIIQMTDNILIN